MGLVDVEKAPKPLPARANGYRWHDCAYAFGKSSRGARRCDEFLLINHPLDCPTCDQGGERQLQDLAMGYKKYQPLYRRKTFRRRQKTWVL